MKKGLVVPQKLKNLINVRSRNPTELYIQNN